MAAPRRSLAFGSHGGAAIGELIVRRREHVQFGGEIFLTADHAEYADSFRVFGVFRVHSQRSDQLGRRAVGERGTRDV